MAAQGSYCVVSWRGQPQAGGAEGMLPGFSEVNYQTWVWAVVCWEATVPDALAWRVKGRDERLWIKASGQCQVYQIELQTAPSSASRDHRHKSKSNLPTSVVWAGLATCHAPVLSATVSHRESNYSLWCHLRITTDGGAELAHEVNGEDYTHPW